MIKKYPLARPYITAQDKAAVLSVLNSGHLSLGPKYKEFEKKFSKKIGVKYACAVSSGTAGLHLIMIAAGIRPGDEVITTPFSFVASANCILYVGAIPVFVDINPITFNLDPAKIEEKITKKTKAILVVHIFGQAANMDPILKLAKKYKLKIIEDACESIGAVYKGRQVGTFGESAVFAFYPNKQMTTGEGGMVVTDSKRIYDLCKSLSNQGRSSDMQWLDHKYLGYNYRLDEMSAALGLEQIKKLGFMISKRRQVAKWYARYLDKYSNLVKSPRIGKNNTHTWFIYVVRVNEKIRDKVIGKLVAGGIGSKPYMPSIHLFDFYKRCFHYKKGAFPVSEEISATSLALPFYIGLKEEDIKYIVGKLIGVIREFS